MATLQWKNIPIVKEAFHFIGVLIKNCLLKAVLSACLRYFKIEILQFLNPFLIAFLNFLGRRIIVENNCFFLASALVLIKTYQALAHR